MRIFKDVAGLGSSYGTISCTDLCERIYAISGVRTVPGEFALPELLGDTSRVTLRSDDCAVTALVVYKNSEDAGKGLNALAITENLLPENPSDDEKDRFWTKDMNLAYALWPRQRHAPWARFRPGSA